MARPTALRADACGALPVQLVEERAAQLREARRREKRGQFTQHPVDPATTGGIVHTRPQDGMLVATQPQQMGDRDQWFPLVQNECPKSRQPIGRRRQPCHAGRSGFWWIPACVGLGEGAVGFSGRPDGSRPCNRSAAVRRISEAGHGATGGRLAYTVVRCRAGSAWRTKDEAQCDQHEAEAGESPPTRALAQQHEPETDAGRCPAGALRGDPVGLSCTVSLPRANCQMSAAGLKNDRTTPQPDGDQCQSAQPREGDEQ